MPLKLDLTSLESAVAQLASGLARANAEAGDELIRDGVIQRFEYTYELSHKMLRRFLEMTEATPSQLAETSFADLIRLAQERGLVRRGWDTWRTFRTARGTTSHAYDEKKAKEVFEQIPQFLSEAQYLLTTLKSRIAAL